MQQTKGRGYFKAQDVEHDALVQIDRRNKVEIWEAERFKLSATIHLPCHDIIASQ